MRRPSAAWRTPPRPLPGTDNGAYYALIIGINQYPNWPVLSTAVSDAQAMDAVLRQRYGFQTVVLVDGAATRTNILDAFAGYRRRLRENDNLLIYYAGHGARDGGKAYWLPVDSNPDSQANWIIADEVTKGMQVIPARHVLVISDSCYSGGLSRAAMANTAPTDRGQYIQTMLSSKSRVLISSGRDEPVADGGSGGHSVFANAILTGLSSAPDQPFTASNLFSRYVQESVVGQSRQVPLFQVIADSGHEYGDFVFLARSASAAGGGVAAPPVPDRRAPAPPGAVTAPPQRSSTRLAPDGRSVSAGPADATGAVPLTDYRVTLLQFRDFPQAMTDAVGGGHRQVANHRRTIELEVAGRGVGTRGRVPGFSSTRSGQNSFSSGRSLSTRARGLRVQRCCRSLCNRRETGRS